MRLSASIDDHLEWSCNFLYTACLVLLQCPQLGNSSQGILPASWLISSPSGHADPLNLLSTTASLASLSNATCPSSPAFWPLAPAWHAWAWNFQLRANSMMALLPFLPLHTCPEGITVCTKPRILMDVCTLQPWSPLVTALGHWHGHLGAASVALTACMANTITWQHHT